MPVPGKISIITPTLNQAGFIERTIRSVQDQQVDVPVEHIVVDGGSTDGTLELLAGYAAGVRLIRDPGCGMQDSLNKGFAMAAGEVVGWLNSDDTYLPGALQAALDHFRQHPECRWVYGNCRIIDEHDHEIRRWITAYKNRLSRRYSYKRLLMENFISQPAVFMLRAELLSAGPVDRSLPTAMDYDLWLRLAQRSAPGYLDRDLACFRVHMQSISARSYRAQFEEQYRIHQRYDRHPLRLFRHRVKIRMIVFVYGILRAVRKFSRQGRK